MNDAFLLLGTNLGVREENLRLAIAGIQDELGKLTGISSVYETEPWGLKEQPSFLNQVIRLETTGSAEQLFEGTVRVEKMLKRQRGVKWGPRIIDIDILYFNKEIFESENIVIPHPRMHVRRFTLVPLAELIPDYIHPILLKSNEKLLQECPDVSEVRKIKQPDVVKTRL